MFDPKGHFSIVITDRIPQVRLQQSRGGTPQENQAVVQGSLAFSAPTTRQMKSLPFILMAARSQAGRAPTRFQTFRGGTHLDRPYSIDRFWNRLRGL
jgi:hypothetical protein